MFEFLKKHLIGTLITSITLVGAALITQFSEELKTLTIRSKSALIELYIAPDVLDAVGEVISQEENEDNANDKKKIKGVIAKLDHSYLPENLSDLKNREYVVTDKVVDDEKGFAIKTIKADVIKGLNEEKYAKLENLNTEINETDPIKELKKDLYVTSQSVNALREVITTLKEGKIKVPLVEGRNSDENYVSLNENNEAIALLFKAKEEYCIEEVGRKKFAVKLYKSNKDEDFCCLNNESLGGKNDKKGTINSSDAETDFYKLGRMESGAARIATITKCEKKSSTPFSSWN